MAASLETKYLAISGMTCAACKGRVERALNAVEGVSLVSVNLIKNEAAVSFDSALCSTSKLISKVKEAGYGASIKRAHSFDESYDENELKRTRLKLYASIFLTIVLMVVSMGPMLGFTLVDSAMISGNIQLVLTLGVMAFNVNYFKSGIKALLHRSSNMDTLVSLGSLSAFGISLFNLLQITDDLPVAALHHAHFLYFESAATILTFVSVGKTLEGAAKHKAVAAISKLYDLAPKTLIKRESDNNAANPSYREVEITMDEVQVGDEIILRTGAKVGVDGVIIEGTGVFNESALTGEARPVSKTVQSKVMSGSFLSDGYVVYKVEKVGEDTVLSQIINLVNEANAKKIPGARYADVVAQYFVPVVIGLAILTFIGWMLAGSTLETALSFAISVLVVSCPCALGLAAPIAIVVSTSKAASTGVLFKSPEAIERLSEVDTIIFDKTGTLTKGKMNVQNIFTYQPTAVAAQAPASEHAPASEDAASMAANVEQHLSSVSDLSSNDVALDQVALFKLKLAKALEMKSEHPIAKAIVTKLEITIKKSNEAALSSALSSDDLKLSDFAVVDGRGVKAKLALSADMHQLLEGVADDGSVDVYMGSTTYMKETLAASHPKLLMFKEKAKNIASQNVVVHLFTKDDLLLTLVLGDELRDDAHESCQALNEMGVTQIIISGDDKRVVADCANTLGIKEYEGALFPKDKSDYIKRLKSSGSKRTIAMMGDGINDAPALSLCDVPVSIASGSDIAKSCASVILMQERLYDVVNAIKLSKATTLNIKQNLLWAFIYNVIFIPVAAGLFFLPYGIKLDPMYAAAMMSLSSLCVVGNSLRLRALKLTKFNLIPVSSDHNAAQTIAEHESVSHGSNQSLDQGSRQNFSANHDDGVAHGEKKDIKSQSCCSFLVSSDESLKDKGPQTASGECDTTAETIAAPSAEHEAESNAESNADGKAEVKALCGKTAFKEKEMASVDVFDPANLQDNEACFNSVTAALANGLSDEAKARGLVQAKVIMINGMSCKHCLNSVKRTLLGLDGCTSALVSLECKGAVALFSSELSDDEVSKAITELDFEVVSVTSYR